MPTPPTTATKSTFRRLGFGAVCATLTSFIFSTNVIAACNLAKYAELAVVMNGRRPVVEGSINGIPATFITDSGAFYSLLWTDKVDRFKLRLERPAGGIEIQGMGGMVDAQVAIVSDFSLRGFAGGVYHKVHFLVAGQATGPEVGILGQNIIGRADTEYDLGNGVIRLFRPSGCENNSLAYWPGTAPVSEMVIGTTSDWESHIVGSAKLNGVPIKVVFDTGATYSVLGLKAATKAGFDPAHATGNWHHDSAIGPRSFEIWLTRFDDLDLGGEEIKHVQMRVSDAPMPGGFDLLLGMDFFLSHRIYVAQSQHKIYFTYTGGRIFEIPETNNNAASTAPTDAPKDETAGESPQDAAQQMRRGAALAARDDLPGAIAAFDTAIRLNPEDAESYYRRGKARMQSHLYPEARSDFDQALKLQPENAAWLNTRGALRVITKDDQGATADFDAATRLTPDAENLDLDIADFLTEFGQLEAAISRVDRWIDAHPNNAAMPDALNSRCWYRGQLGKELEKALADCNESLRLKPHVADALDSRGLVYLRLGDYDRSIADYKAALKRNPKQSMSLYGLGMAQLRKGQKEDASTSMQKALAINSQTAERFRKFGVAP